MRLVKGSHIVVRRLYEGDHAYALQHPDRRLVFVIPYQDEFTLIGTTDVPWHGEPGTAAITPAETDYLCQAVNRYFERQIAPGDVVWSYAGIRALWDDEASEASAVTRDYVLDLDAPTGQAPVLSVFGGKITTYRRLAELALEKLESQLGPMATARGRSPRRCPAATFRVAMSMRSSPTCAGAGHFSTRRRRGALPMPTARALRVLDGVGSREAMGEDFGGGMTRLEVDYLVREEWARSAEDIYWRHSKTGLHASPADQQRLVAYLQNIPYHSHRDCRYGPGEGTAMSRPRHVLAIDQGTTSTRTIVFDDAGARVAIARREFASTTRPPAGWSTMRRTSGATRWRRRARHRASRPRRARHRRHRHHQPARDHGGLGARHRQAHPSGHRLAGPAHGRDLRRA